jgi:hypothetical protein
MNAGSGGMKTLHSITKTGAGIRLSLLIGVVLAIVGITILTSRLFAQTDESHENAPSVSFSAEEPPVVAIPMYMVYAGVYDEKQASTKVNELNELGMSTNLTLLSDQQWGVLVSRCFDYSSASNVKVLLAKMDIDAFITTRDYDPQEQNTDIDSRLNKRERLYRSVREMGSSVEESSAEDLVGIIDELEKENDRIRQEIERIKQEDEEAQAD